MQADAQHARGRDRVLVQLIELVAEHLLVVRTALTPAQEDSEVVDFNRIRHCHHVPRGSTQPVRLVVVHPVADVAYAKFSQELDGTIGLAEPRPEPSQRLPPGRAFDDRERLRDQFPLRTLRLHEGDALTVRPTVTHEVPTKRNACFDDFGIELAHA